ncbi:DoxX family protein [bacterium]|nr:DoxX family protein [bacterium]
MIDFDRFIHFFLIISFLFYGASCFLSQHIRKEFVRYKMNRWRKLTGALQIACCLGLSIGFYMPIFKSLSALLLTVIMSVALIVRLRIRDSAVRTSPALIYFLLSLFLFWKSVQ